MRAPAILYRLLDFTRRYLSSLHLSRYMEYVWVHAALQKLPHHWGVLLENLLGLKNGVLAFLQGMNNALLSSSSWTRLGEAIESGDSCTPPVVDYSFLGVVSSVTSGNAFFYRFMICTALRRHFRTKVIVQSMIIQSSGTRSLTKVRTWKKQKQDGKAQPKPSRDRVLMRISVNAEEVWVVFVSQLQFSTLNGCILSMDILRTSMLAQQLTGRWSFLPSHDVKGLDGAQTFRAQEWQVVWLSHRFCQCRRSCPLFTSGFSTIFSSSTCSEKQNGEQPPS